MPRALTTSTPWPPATPRRSRAVPLRPLVAVLTSRSGAVSRILPNIDFASRRSFAIAAAAAASAGAFLPTTASAGVLDLIGYSDLAARNGALLERGAGVDV